MAGHDPSLNTPKRAGSNRRLASFLRDRTAAAFGVCKLVERPDALGAAKHRSPVMAMNVVVLADISRLGLGTELVGTGGIRDKLPCGWDMAD